jgi:hypothetical protein
MKHLRPPRSLAAAVLALVLAPSPANATPAGFGVVDVAGQPGPPTRVATHGLFDPATLGDPQRAIRRVEAMPDDEVLQRRAARLGLGVVNVLWEDTGRFGGSAVGPNISDVTLQLREPVDAAGQRFRTHLLPVLRAPNFTDRTADIAAEQLWVRIGNQSRGAQAVSVPLREVLAHLREYVTDPDSVLGSGDLSAPRDTHYLVSAQHVFVPIPARGKVEFTPVIFNYQSRPQNPAVLTLLVTRQGTSIAVIDNATDRAPASGGAGQTLYFNNEGQKTTLTAERRSTVEQRIASGQATAEDDGALDEGADLMLIVQVPLQVRSPPPTVGIGSIGSIGFLGGAGTGAGGGGFAPTETLGFGAGTGAGGRGRGDVERAVLGHGDDLGEFSEGRGLKLERDPRFPVRVTVQFYKATSNGVVTKAELAAARRQIERVYAHADAVGSLVVPEGERTRPTDWHLGVTQPVPIVSRHITPPTSPVDLTDSTRNGEHRVVDESGDEAGAGDAEPTAQLAWWQRVRSWLRD